MTSQGSGRFSPTLSTVREEEAEQNPPPPPPHRSNSLPGNGRVGDGGNRMNGEQLHDWHGTFHPNENSNSTPPNMAMTGTSGNGVDRRRYSWHGEPSANYASISCGMSEDGDSDSGYSQNGLPRSQGTMRGRSNSLPRNAGNGVRNDRFGHGGYPQNRDTNARNGMPEYVNENINRGNFYSQPTPPPSGTAPAAPAWNTWMSHCVPLSVIFTNIMVLIVMVALLYYCFATSQEKAIGETTCTYKGNELKAFQAYINHIRAKNLADMYAKSL